MPRSTPKVTITHHNVKEPEYNLDALRCDLKRSREHVTILRREITQQLNYQKHLRHLITLTQRKSS